MSDQSQNAQWSNHQSNELLAISMKFKVKRDLYSYMTYRSGCFLPNFKKCPMSYLQQILSDQKSTLQEIDVVIKKLPHIKEFSTQHLINENHISKEIYDKYFPDPPIIVDREFAWGIWLTVEPEKAQKYVQKIMDSKIPTNKLPKKQTLEISAEWLKKLQIHPNIPSKNVKQSSIFIKLQKRDKKQPIFNFGPKKRNYSNFNNFHQIQQNDQPIKKLKILDFRNQQSQMNNQMNDVQIGQNEEN